MTQPLAEIQRAMVRSITDPNGSGIYRTLVRRGLSGALRTELPRTSAHLGARWDRDVESYLDTTLPRSRYLRDAARELYDFVSPSWQSDPDVPPFILDLARWELLAFEIMNAPDDPPMEAPAPLELDRPVAMSSSARIFRAAHAVHLLAEDAPLLEVPRPEPTTLLVYRDADFDQRTLSLTPSAEMMLEQLLAGVDLGKAVSHAAFVRGAALDDTFLQAAARLLEDLAERGVVRGSM